jgi:O-antigen ligase
VTPASLPSTVSVLGRNPAPAATLTPPAPAVDLQWETDLANPLRRFTFYFALAAIYIRFSVIHEALAVYFNLNLYLLYFVMPPVIVGVILSGGIRRTWAARTARYWIVFLAWLCLAAPFSAWRGGSAVEVYTYVKAEFIMLFVVAGLAMTWKECRMVMYSLILAAVTDLGIGRTFANQGSDRMNLSMGGSTIANSNDFAAHLVLMMAFLLYLVIAPRMPTLVRLISLPAILYGIFLILGSGSRGALVALIVAVIYTFAMGSSTYRMLLLVTVPVAAVVVVSALPQATLLRLGTLTSDSGNRQVQEDAEGSSRARLELLKKSLVYTIQHPLFGVGPGQFAIVEGGEATSRGRQGIWHETHNSFTQISSECGIPALIFFVAAIVSAFRLALKTYRQARANPANRDIAAVMFCLMLGIVGFMTAITFANFGYRFYEPALCGLCMVMYTAAQHEMAARQSKAASMAPAVPPWAPAQPLVAPAPSFASKLR